ncbi:MAG: nucleotidyltransferase domain-containing protein [Nanoarchaeota archaeon]
MNNQTFTHVISRGSRFNQIYIPKDKMPYFEVGDLVEVNLLEKGSKFYYSKNTQKLSPFKEEITRKIFSVLTRYPEIKQVFIFGSFLTKDLDYNDIDVMIVSEIKNLEEKFHSIITKEVNFKMHLICVNEKELSEQLKISPLVRSMLYNSLSNKPIPKMPPIIIDENHIKYLLMFPEDLSKYPLDSGKVFYDSLRKLLSIKHFLERKEYSQKNIDLEIKETIGEKIFSVMKNDHQLAKKTQKELQNILRKEIAEIYAILNHDKKR